VIHVTFVVNDADEARSLLDEVIPNRKAKIVVASAAAPVEPYNAINPGQKPKRGRKAKAAPVEDKVVVDAVPAPTPPPSLKVMIEAPTPAQVTTAQGLLKRVLEEKSFETALALLSRYGVQRFREINDAQVMSAFIVDAESTLTGKFDPIAGMAA